MTKNVLITGGSRGIGLGIAMELAKKGYGIAINGRRDLSAVTKTIEALKSWGSKVVYCQGDISKPEDRDTMVADTVSALGRIDVLVNNAGVGPEKRMDILQTTPESYSRVMDTNLMGPFFLTQKIASLMIDNAIDKEGTKGCIINISSVSATMASITRGEYCISKAGLSMMTKLFAVRLGEHNIPVFEVRPGIIETDMTAGVLSKYQELIDKGLTVQARLGQPEDVGTAVAALVEGKFPYATGQVIMIDGGLTIPRL